METSERRGSRLRARTRKGTRTLHYWTSAWLLSNALLAFGPEFLWDEMLEATLVAFGISVAIGVGFIIANKKHLQTLDELHQKVMLDAMAITLGVVFVVGVPYSLLDAYEVVGFDSGIAIPIAALYVLMSVTYKVSMVLGLRRYR